jgi:hypothetical protein
MKRPAEIYLAIFLFGYYMSYPLKVFLVNTQVSTQFVSGLIGWTVVIYYFIKKILARHFEYLSIRRFIILFALTVAAANIALSANYHNNPLTLSANANKYLIYLGACIPMIVISKGGISRSSSLLRYVVVAAAILYAISAILNSTYRLPTDLIEPLDAKYFVGPFLRAGAGYLDPNFLAINLITLLIFSNYITMGKMVRLIVISACVIGIFMTFSRAAWLVTAALLIMPIINKKSFIQIGVILILGVLSLSIGQSWLFDDDGLFRRFFDEEGASSTADRVRQYIGAISELQNISFESAFFGIGGADTFFSKYGAHLHNFYLGAFVDGGVLSVIIPLVTLLLTYYWTSGISRRLITAWFAMSLFLPDVPDTFYLTIALAVVLGLSTSKNSVKLKFKNQNQIPEGKTQQNA